MCKNKMAFPRPNTTTAHGHRQLGMELREYFAGQALVGILANPDRIDGDDQIVNHAYHIADLMLKAGELEVDQ